MDKVKLVEDYKKQEDKMLLSQILDKIEMSERKGSVEVTDFLDMYQNALVEKFLRKIKIDNVKLWGGYEEAERKICIFFQDTLEESDFLNELKIIRIKLQEADKGKYSHRNYLGGVVKVGIKREKVGDIIVFDDGADIIVKSEISEGLVKELKGLNRFENAEFQILDISELRRKEVQKEEISIIVPSLRLDNIVSDLARTSRNKAVEILKQERVFVNGQNEIKPSKNVKLQDVITIRGKGRFVIKEFSGTTRSGRTVVIVEKFV